MISNYWVYMDGRLMNHRPRIVLSGSPFSCTLPKKARPVLAHGQESIEVVLWGKTFPSFHSFPCALLLLLKALSLSPFSPSSPFFPLESSRSSSSSSPPPFNHQPFVRLLFPRSLPATAWLSSFSSLSPSSSLLHEPRLLESLLTLPPPLRIVPSRILPLHHLILKRRTNTYIPHHSSYYPHNHYHHITSRYWGALGVCIFPVSWLSP